MTAVGHVIPAIPACPVRPKSGHSANSRVYKYTPPRSRRHARRQSQRRQYGGLDFISAAPPGV